MDNLESSSRKHLGSLSLATPRMHTQALTLIWMHMMKQHHISYIPSQNFVKLISRNFEIPQKFRENIFFTILTLIWHLWLQVILERRKAREWAP